MLYGLIPQNFAELAEAVPIVARCTILVHKYVLSFSYSKQLTLVMLNSFIYPQFCPVKLQHYSCISKHVFSIRVENTADPDQMATSEAI